MSLTTLKISNPPCFLMLSDPHHRINTTDLEKPKLLPCQWVPASNYAIESHSVTSLDSFFFVMLVKPFVSSDCDLQNGYQRCYLPAV